MKINNQRGRSMVEMLGVLAIIGVLSVGGIVSYSYAMAKYKANTLTNDLNLRAVTISQQLSTHKDPSLNEFKDTPMFTIGLDVFAPNSEKYFALKAENIPQRVCEHIIMNVPVGVSGIYQENRRIHNVTDCLDKTTLLFVYQNDLGQDASFATNDNYACAEKCPTGSINPTCATSEKQKDTGTMACGRICAVCLNDICPSGTSTSCNDSLTPTPAGTTDYGTQCYTCN